MAEIEGTALIDTIKAIRKDHKDCDQAGAEKWALTLGFAPTIKRIAK